MPFIHPTAIVDPAAKLAESVTVGPYCVVGPQVEAADNVELKSHVVLEGRTSVGPGTTIYPFASIGVRPQDLKYKGEESRLEIGANVTIREHVTANPGTEGGGMLTKIGDSVLLAIGAHVAHDCFIGDGSIVMNNVLLGGHVVIGEAAVIGGGSAIHQFVRIGKHAMIGGASGVENDVIPFGTVFGNRAHLHGLNLVGMKRRGFSREDIHALRNAYKQLFSHDEGKVMADRLRGVAEQYPDSEAVRDVVAFMEAESSRAICQPAPSAGGGDAA
ncbi:Acyl-[acyl-carrier-protein]--UDP-N-acetylglucosamine O-acyltransferase [Caenispirillum salinarum AK4]|uniref:Acyl-[acyl-carrier-protein]--UDP-N-acetylglucosamine O-acyltransferase n=1 Tax=Caenispirillum salinarum AK4 TaxID=1238182 RepID=K9H184_9PROT|nr:acyl-ACP--UDP-N-acetylglucosamine O-acyltransferase [Caenispirillum salinarum]EKV30814.1 Acyl-[acyl-carrier-protein]--UDP-N-acetylglucosamine O-acyltransferase [Caenispirillum salinarum AK4]